jgi:hypothetical protein
VHHLCQDTVEFRQSTVMTRAPARIKAAIGV